MIYLLGGCSGFQGPLRNSFQTHLRAYKTIGFIPSDASKTAKTQYYADQTISWFEDAGIHFESYHIIDQPTMPCPDVIYLMGGNPLTQLDLLQKEDFKAYLQKAKVLIGNSAGAMNLCNKVMLTKDADFEKDLFYTGLGLTDVCIEVHYRSEKNESVRQLMLEQQLDLVYGLPEEEGILIDQGITKLGMHIEEIRR